MSMTVRPAPDSPAPLELDPEQLQGPEQLQAQYEAAGVPTVPFQPLPQDEAPTLDPDGLFGAPGDASVYEAPTTAAGSTASSPAAALALDPATLKQRSKLLAPLAGAAFAMVSGLVNWRLRIDDEDTTWLADGDDVKAVGAPAGRLIARHSPLPDGEETSDVVDAIELALAGAGYVMKNLMKRVDEVNRRRRQAGGDQPAAE